MDFGRLTRGGLLLACAAALVVPGCGPRKPKDINAIVPTVTLNRDRVPLKSAVEVTYSWKCEPTMKKLTEEHRAFVHFVDKDGYTLFTDDHMPTPAPTSWEPGKTYSYSRTVFVPSYQYVGKVEVRVGLEPVSGARRTRVAMKGDDTGLREYRVATLEFLPEIENIYLVEKEGWHDPETSRDNPGLERTWTKRQAVTSFKNPKKDVVVYLEADTNAKAFSKPPALVVSVGGKTGVVVPITSSELFLKRIRFKAADLGDADWVDLRLTMSDSFVPKDLGLNDDWRELGLMVYHLHVLDADQLGTLPSGTEVLDAGPLSPEGLQILKAAAVSKTKKAAAPAKL